MAADANNAAGTMANKQYTYVLRATNFTSAIPTDATIDGIKVEVRRCKRMSDGTLKDDLVQLTKNGATRVGVNNADTSTPWTTTMTTKEYGGSTALWGANWTAAEINASTLVSILRYITRTVPKPVLQM
jgi:hypothetical protein